MSVLITKVYHQGDAYYADLLDAIKVAQSEVLIESYIFDFDEIGQALLTALGEGARRGVRTWLVIDGIGSYSSLPEIGEFCRTNKINLGIYHPSPLTVLRFGNFSFNTLFRVFHFLKKLNNRNHRKVTAIDGRIAFLGSFNISRVHSTTYLGPAAWRDSGIQCRGQEVEHLRRAFYLSWKKCRRIISQKHFLSVPPYKNQSLRMIYLNYRFRQRFLMNRVLKRSIRQAKQRIYITSPYFIPKGSLLRSLKRAAKNGLDVKLCLPHNTDVFIVRLASYALFRNLLIAGVKIFEYQPANLHAKYKLIDDKVWVGSKNLNHRSLIHDLEVEVVDDSAATVESFAKQWQLDLHNSQAIELKDLDRVPLWKMMFSHLFFIFRYWL